MKKIVLLMVISSGLVFASTGADISKRCVSCHGVKFDKAPLGRTKHIIVKNNKTVDALVNRIKYFQNPEEEDEMIMKTQVEKLTDAEVKAVSEYIISQE